MEISVEQMKKLPADFVLFACPKCEGSLFALDQDTVEDGNRYTEACCLGCGNTFTVS